MDREELKAIVAQMLRELAPAQTPPSPPPVKGAETETPPDDGVLPDLTTVDLRAQYLVPNAAHGAEFRALKAKTPPPRGRDGVGLQKLLCVSISIHAPRTGSDCSGSAYFWISASFQSTLPARGATDRADAGEHPRKRFQSTLPARGATTPPTSFRAGA